MSVVTGQLSAPGSSPGAAARSPALLDGLRVASFCHYLQGPAATQYLADMGADIIKVEPLDGAFERRWSGARAFVNGVSAFFMSANRNKRSLAVDLKHPEGREIVLKLIDSCDAVVENYRPGVMDRLELSYDELSRRKPEIIYASATGFGSSGPMRDRPGQDLLVQARSGLVVATGDAANRPTPVGCAAVDQHGAALLAMGILGAYVKRLTTGQGTRVEASLLNAGIDLQAEALTLYYSQQRNADVLRRDPHLATWFHEAPYGIYPIADGFLALSLGATRKIAEALGSGALARAAEADAYAERDTVACAVAEAVRQRSFAELSERFDAHGVWYERVQNYEDLRADPQIQHNACFRDIAVGDSTATLVNHPLRFDGVVPDLVRMPWRPGENTREILAELGLSDADVRRLCDEGVVGLPSSQEEHV